MYFSFIILIYLMILLVVPVLVGVYVYRDAKRCGMNAALWTLIAVLAPMLIGFIIYLIVRGGYSDLMCPRCGTAVTEQYVVCPKCGVRLRPTCPHCKMPVEPGWKVCPRCAAELSGSYEDIATPVQRKDRTLGKILLLVILIPVLLILFAIVGGIAYGRLSSTETGSSSAMVCYQPEEYLKEQAASEHYEELKTWIDGCDETTGKAYVLQYQTEDGGEKVTEYLVYWPGEEQNIGMDLGNTGMLQNDTLEVNYVWKPGEDYTGLEGYRLCATRYRGNSYAGLSVTRNGGEMDWEVVKVDFPVYIPE